MQILLYARDHCHCPNGQCSAVLLQYAEWTMCKEEEVNKLLKKTLKVFTNNQKQNLQS